MMSKNPRPRHPDTTSLRLSAETREQLLQLSKWWGEPYGKAESITRVMARAIKMAYDLTALAREPLAARPAPR